MLDGSLHVNVTAVVAGYALMRWNIGCSEDYSLDGSGYHLWFKDRQAFFGVKELVIAPRHIKDEKE